MIEAFPLSEIKGLSFDPSDALCAQTDPELFFPEKEDVGKGLMAKKICQECSLIKECLSEALLGDVAEGIWGGTAPRDRHWMRRALQNGSKTIDELVTYQAESLRKLVETMEYRTKSRMERLKRIDRERQARVRYERAKKLREESSK